jgi:hypothetical protein
MQMPVPVAIAPHGHLEKCHGRHGLGLGVAAPAKSPRDRGKSPVLERCGGKGICGASDQGRGGWHVRCFPISYPPQANRRIYMHRPDPRLAPVAIAAAGTLAVATALPSATDAEDIPYSQPDHAWVSLQGHVKKVAPDRFELDYGEGVITVEMDDGDRDADAYKLIAGDKVSVVGRIDNDLFESTTIEASSVHLHEVGTTFFASAVDEEDVDLAVGMPMDMAATTVRGTVDAVGEDRFTLDTGATKLTVTTGELGYDPLDDEGYQKVETGDRVSVSGDIDERFFGGAEMSASRIVLLEDRRKAR